MNILGIDFVSYEVNDVARSIAFYRDVLGLKISSQYEDKWVEFDAPPTTFCIYNPKEFMGFPARISGGSVAFAVDDIPAALAEFKAKGVTIVSEGFDSPVCQMAVIADPDGNGIVLHRRKDGTHG
ncbi:MAG: VOC family protein [Verrucomicrobiota bacterium]|nr:VOC family protein [Verrucomicrobiota bacterium]